MLFVRVDDLKAGMRLGKPIYNKNGVLLYERDSKLTMQAIYGIKNFGLMGIYILEPAEPLPPMSEADINFERFQTMAVFSIREDLDLIANGKKDKGLDWLCGLIMKNYSGQAEKINFVQGLRSSDDFTYKHSLNVAILTAIISGEMGLPVGKTNQLVKAAVLHDIGVLKLPGNPVMDEINEDLLELSKRNTADILHHQKDLDSEIGKIIMLMQDMVTREELGGAPLEEGQRNISASILHVADAFDRMTAMKSYEEPTSELSAVRTLLGKLEYFDEKIINALVQGINILYPGVCVELTNHEKGLVIVENNENIFEPWVLNFSDNQLYDLSSPAVKQKFVITDIMKTMDNRIKIDPELLKEYQY